jgi:uncharacterized protein (TIGR02001 family)
MLAGPALADGMPSKGRIASPESRACSVSGSVGVTSENVFRGISKSAEDASVQGGLELSCGRFYVGVSGATSGFFLVGDDVDFTAGFRSSFGKINVDAGVTYYTFQGGLFDDELNFAEFKLAANTQVWKGGTLSGSVAYASDYFGVFGDVMTYEVGFAQALPKVGMFSPTLSAAYGYSDFLDASDGSYAYWNVGVTLGFLEKWSVDLRYHDTDGEGLAGLANFLGGITGAGALADERFVATLKYSF